MLEMNLARRALLHCLSPVAEREPGSGGEQPQLARRAHPRPGLDRGLQGVVIDGECRDLRAIVILQVIPRPAGAKGRAMEIALIAHEVSGDALYPGVGQSANQRLERLVNIASVQAGIYGWVTAAIDN